MALPKSRSRRPAKKEGEELIEKGYDNSIALDGSQKKPCPGCGLLRDVALAARAACSACGTWGTAEKAPDITEDDLDIVADVREPERAIVEDYSESDTARAVLLVQKAAKAEPVIEPVAQPVKVAKPAAIPAAQPKKVVDVKSLFLTWG